MRKKLVLPLAALVAVLTLALLVACGSSKKSDKVKAGGGSSGGLETIEEQVIYDGTADGNGVIITAKRISDDSFYGKGLVLQIDNQSSQNYMIQCDYVVVNGFMMSHEVFSSDITAGKKANDTLYLSSRALKEMGIDTIGEIDVSFNIIDPNTYQTVFTTPEIAVTTSEAGNVQEADLSGGGELYNADGIKIVGKYVNEDSFWGAGIMLYIENNSGRDVEIQCNDMSVNGYMMTPYFSCRVNNGRKALDEITLLSNELEENGIKKIEKGELNFVIFDPNTYQTIAESGPVSFSM